MAIASKVGDDAFGKMAMDWLASAVVDLSRVRRATNGTGTGLSVILNQAEHRFILTYPGTMFELGLTDLDLDFIFSAQHFHVSSYFPHRALRPHMVESFRKAKAAGLLTSIDTNDDPAGKWSRDLLDVLPYVDILFPNEREAQKIAEVDDLQAAVAAGTGPGRYGIEWTSGGSVSVWTVPGMLLRWRTSRGVAILWCSFRASG